MNRGVFAEVRSARVVAGHDGFDMEALGQKAAFRYSACACAGRGRDNLRKYSRSLANKHISKRRKECTDAIRCDDTLCHLVRALKMPLYCFFVLLHCLATSLAILFGAILVCGKWRIHDYHIKITQREANLFAFVNLFAFKRFERKQWGEHGTQVGSGIFRRCQDFQRPGPWKPFRLRAMGHGDQIHA